MVAACTGAFALIAGDFTLAVAQFRGPGSPAAAVVTTIPAGYTEPAGGWAPRCNAGFSVCALRAQKGGEMFVLINGKPSAGYDEVADIVFSDDGRQVAQTARRSSTWFVVTDGKEGPAFDKIEGLRFLGNLPLYIADRSARGRDTSDGVFRGTRRVEGFKNPGFEGGADQPIREVVVGEKVDDIPVVAEERRGSITQITLSPDARSYAYNAEVPGSSGPLFMLMLNGREVREDNGLSIFSFTEDGRLAYATRTGSLGEGQAKIMVGKEVAVHFRGDIPAGAISRDGRLIAFVGCTGGQPERRGNGGRVANVMPRIVGTCELKLGDKVLRHGPEGALGNVSFSPDGATVAFTERQGDKIRAVVGGKDGPRADDLLTPIIFSGDGKRHAYAARIGAKSTVVLDGVAGEVFDAVEHLRFSPDSMHLAYVATQSGTGRLVIDRRQGQPSAWVSPPQFDRAGRTVAFVALDGRQFSRRSAAVGR